MSFVNLLLVVMELNQLPEGYEIPPHRQKIRRTKFESPTEKLQYDADNLIALAQKVFREKGIMVSPVDLITRKDDDVDVLKREIAIRLKTVPATNEATTLGAVDALAVQAAVSAHAKPTEAYEVDPRLVALKSQYEDLSDADRTYKGKVRTWPEVARAIPNMPDFLEGLSTLTEPKPYFLNEKGQLVVGDGFAESPKATLGLNYHKSRTAQTRISYLDQEGTAVVVNGDDTEIPADAKVLSEKGLIKLDEEYRRVNKGQFEKANWTWTESGKNPSVARAASWGCAGVFFSEDFHCSGSDFLGSRGVLRVNLNFES